MKQSIFKRILKHLFTPRFFLTVTYLQWLFWLKATDRGDTSLEINVIIFFGISLALAWLYCVIQAFDKTRRYLLLDLGLEATAAITVLALSSSTLPFQWAFPLSRPALEKFAAEVDEPKSIDRLEPVGVRVGMLRVLAVRHDEAGNLVLTTFNSSMRSHYLVCHPQKGSRRLRNGTYLGHGWYQYSHLNW